MISKTLTGVSFFDDRYGGAYRGRSMLVSGRAGSGKSLFGLQFIAQGVRQGECSLLLSGRPVADVAIYADAIGLPLGEAVENGAVIVLEYSDYVPGQVKESELVLPSEGIVQLQEIVQSNAVRRVVLDTCLPWMTMAEPDGLARHAFSFVRSFDRLGVTTVLTLPKPVSPVAFKLKHILEDIVPISVNLMRDEDANQRTWIVNKYLGESRLDGGVEFDITPGLGLHASQGSTPAASEPVTDARATQNFEDLMPYGPLPVDNAATDLQGSGVQPPPKRERIRFSNVVMGNSGKASESAESGRGAKPENREKKPSFARILDESK